MYNTNDKIACARIHVCSWIPFIYLCKLIIVFESSAVGVKQSASPSRHGVKLDMFHITKIKRKNSTGLKSTLFLRGEIYLNF